MGPGGRRAILGFSGVLCPTAQETPREHRLAPPPSRGSHSSRPHNGRSVRPASGSSPFKAFTSRWRLSVRAENLSVAQPRLLFAIDRGFHSTREQLPGFSPCALSDTGSEAHSRAVRPPVRGGIPTRVGWFPKGAVSAVFCSRAWRLRTRPCGHRRHNHLGDFLELPAEPSDLRCHPAASRRPLSATASP